MSAVAIAQFNMSKIHKDNMETIPPQWIADEQLPKGFNKDYAGSRYMGFNYTYYPKDGQPGWRISSPILLSVK